MKVCIEPQGDGTFSVYAEGDEQEGTEGMGTPTGGQPPVPDDDAGSYTPMEEGSGEDGAQSAATLDQALEMARSLLAEESGEDAKMHGEQALVDGFNGVRSGRL